MVEVELGALQHLIQVGQSVFSDTAHLQESLIGHVLLFTTDSRWQEERRGCSPGAALQSNELGKERFSHVEVSNRLLGLLDAPHAQLEHLLRLVVEAESQVELQAEVVRVAHQEVRRHLLALRVILPLVVRLGQVERDQEVVGEFIVGSLVQINGKLVIFIVHEQMSVIQHRMFDDCHISLTVLDHLEDLFGLGALVVLTEDDADSQRACRVHFVELEHAEVLLHGLAQFTLLSIDVRPVERARLVVDVCDADTGVRVALVAHLERFLVLLVGLRQAANISQEATFHTEELGRQAVVGVFQVLGLALLNVVDRPLQVTSSLRKVGEFHVGICIAWLFAKNSL